MESAYSGVAFFLTIFMYLAFPVIFSWIRYERNKKTEKHMVIWLAIVNTVAIRGSVFLLWLLIDPANVSPDMGAAIFWGFVGYFIMRGSLRKLLYKEGSPEDPKMIKKGRDECNENI